MSGDFNSGMQNNTSNVGNWAEWERGKAYQDAANAINNGVKSDSPHATGISWGVGGSGGVISGDNPVMQFIASIPFIVVGTVLYPITAVASVVAALLCTRLLPLFGAGWERWLAYVPALVVFWFCMRWDVRAGQRSAAYRRARHVARILAFAPLGYVVVGRFVARDSAEISQLIGAVVGAGLGHLFLTRGEAWRDFWYRTLARLRIHAA